MRCANCGNEIPQGMLYCKRCGEEVRIVPDYNPLDDMLTTQIRVSLDENSSEYIDNIHSSTRNTSSNRTSVKQNTSRNRKTDDREVRRKQAEKRRALKRRKKRRLLIILSILFLAFAGLIVLLYMTSYTGIVRKGNKALLASEYSVAQECFEKAIQKNPEQIDAYNGLAQIFLQKGDTDSAEKVYLDAVSAHPDNVLIHESLIQFYLETNQSLKIPTMMAESSKRIRDKLNNYIISKPVYSLETGIVYDEVQQLTLESDSETIYYTLDGSEPTFSSIKYTEPIQLNEGETVVKAFAVNKQGVPGLPESKTYVIELPIEDAPAISPSTGQYDKPMKIEIKVPDGYTAYYTMDGSTPTTASSKYNGPINMPENDTLFKAILVNSAGRSSGITTRNYILELSDEED